MPPSFSVNNIINSAIRHAKLKAKLPVSESLLVFFILLAYVLNGFFGQFCLRTVNTPSVNRSSPSVFIIAVILLGSNVEMIRIYAWGVIAFVEYTKTFWNRTVRNRPSITMRFPHFVVVHENTVSRIQKCCSPFQALSSFDLFYLIPKPFFDVLVCPSKIIGSWHVH